MSDRSVDAATTFVRVAPFLSELGITRVGKQTGLDNLGIPVWFACAPNSRAIVIAQGKGLTDEAARTSAAMEAIERAVAGQPHCATVRATRADFGRRGLAFDAVEEFLASKSLPPEPDEDILWTKATNIADGQDVYVPFDAVHLDRTQPSPRYWISSDGLACGNNRAEALFHALLERVERDAHRLWQMMDPARRYDHPLDPTTIADPDIDALVVKIEKSGLALRLFAITSDIGIPVFSALLAPFSVENGHPLRHVEVTEGAGAHIYPARAVVRAITEAAQSRMTYIAGARDDLPPALFAQPLHKEIRAAFFPRPLTAYRVENTLANPASNLLDIVRQRLAAAQIRRLYAIELSKADLPFSVVKILAPQLESPDGNRRIRFGNRALSSVLR